MMYDEPKLIDAIVSLVPDCVCVVCDGVIDWQSSDIPQPSDDAIAAELARLQTEWNAQEYARNRATEYASIQDQLDMQYWDSVNGTTTWADHVEAIKTKYPKP